MPVTISEDITGVASVNSGQIGGRRNVIINGAMVVDQRNAGASVTLTNGVSYILDRYRAVAIGSSLGFSSVRSAVAPTGFSQSYLATVTSAKSVAATDQTRIDQFIEGYSVANLNFGTANAKTITLSFWVRSSITGTYCVHIGNSTSPSRSYLAEYAISSADTFEYKTITIPGDTTGTWATGTGVGLGVSFVLGMGSNFTGSAGWQAGEEFQTSNQTQWIGTSGATFYITGVQIEVGATATDFEYRTFGDELALCQRYYFRETAGAAYSAFAIGVVESATSSGAMMRGLPVPMRSLPTCNVSNCRLADGSAFLAVTSLGTNWSSQTTWGSAVSASAGGMTVGRAVVLQANNNTAAYIDALAEL